MSFCALSNENLRRCHVVPCQTKTYTGKEKEIGAFALKFPFALYRKANLDDMDGERTLRKRVDGGSKDLHGHRRMGHYIS